MASIDVSRFFDVRHGVALQRITRRPAKENQRRGGIADKRYSPIRAIPGHRRLPATSVYTPCHHCWLTTSVGMTGPIVLLPHGFQRRGQHVATAAAHLPRQCDFRPTLVCAGAHSGELFGLFGAPGDKRSVLAIDKKLLLAPVLREGSPTWPSNQISAPARRVDR